MTLAFPEEIIIGGDGAWHAQLRFNVPWITTGESRIRQGFFVKETPTSTASELEFLTKEGPDTWEAYSVIM